MNLRHDKQIICFNLIQYNGLFNLTISKVLSNLIYAVIDEVQC